MNPKYPIYIISKGRWEKRLTSKALELIKVPYKIVVEPQEYDNYAAVIDPKKILVLPFKNLGQGSIPVRNWVWEHSISIGAKKYWIMDDNISDFWRYSCNVRIKVQSGTILRIIEIFTDRYTNIALSGPNYYMFITDILKIPPVVFNTRIYSCILIRNDIPQRWRGKYNEDTDLSLRLLKDGWCTALFNTFLARKEPTMRQEGGNTDELYADGNREKYMTQSLIAQHPDVVKKTHKWGRIHHQVNYAPFNFNKLKRKKEFLHIPDRVNEFGMKLMWKKGDKNE